MSPDTEDTIAAIASAPGSALRGIIRVSGPQTMDQLLGAFTFAKHDEIRERLNSANDAIRLDVVIQLPEELDVEAQLMFWPDERLSLIHI